MIEIYRVVYCLPMGKLRGRAVAVNTQGSSPWKSAREKQRERADKREAVLRAAAELFVTRGFHGTTLSDVALRLNITKPAIYYYFGSKDEILIECTRLGLEAVERFFAEHAGGSLSGRERLERFMIWYAENMTTPFGMCVVRIAEQDVEPETHKELARAKRVVDRRIRQLVDAGIEDGSVAPCDQKVAAFTVAGALSWIGHWYRPGGPWSPREAAERVTALLVQGLAPRREP